MKIVVAVTAASGALYAAFASSNCSGPKRFPKSRSFTALMPVKWLISKE